MARHFSCTGRGFVSLNSVKELTMKKKILHCLIILEICAIFVYEYFIKIEIKSWLLTAVITAVLLAPVLCLLRIEIKSGSHSARKNKFFTFLFWFLILAYLGGLIGTFCERFIL